MLAAMGDITFVMGNVNQSAGEWLASPAMQKVLYAGIAECIACLCRLHLHSLV